MTRAAVVFPGRGAYLPSSLGALEPSHPWVRRADELRADAGLPPVSELDAAPRFDPAAHLRPSNAWPLTFLASLLDAERIAEDHDAVVVTASSTGWYTALAASGVLNFDDAFRLVQRMALVADEPLPGGERPAELIYPLADEAWRRDEARDEAVKRVLREADGEAFRTLELGAFAVIGGGATAIQRVASGLDPVTASAREYPLRLPGGDAWHTPLRAEAVAAAVAELEDLRWERPNVALVDGRGTRFTPWSGDPGGLASSTLQDLPTATYDTASAVRVALREYAPEVVLLPGPGSSLGAACAHLIVTEGYRGVHSRSEFEAAQRSDAPLLLSMRR
jgi:[acyl-carrier-protein] S-malonyltransferase